MTVNLLRQKSLVFGLIATSIISGAYAYSPNNKQQPDSLYNTLDYYGFKTTKQKDALRFLMQQAGVKNIDASLDTKATDSNQLASRVIWLLKSTQKHFTTDAQERWEVKTSDWMRNAALQPQILSALNTLNMIEAVEPKFTDPDAMAILGARTSIMRERIKDANILLTTKAVSTKSIILLAGERYVTFDKNHFSIDGSPEELETLAKALGKNVADITETDLIKAEYAKSPLSEKFTPIVIDTPRGNLPRPTTETTVAELCKWLKKHPEVKITSIIFISRKPSDVYQKEIIKQVLEKENIHIRIDVVGSKYTLSPDNPSHDIKVLTVELGKQIYAATPGVLDAIGLEITDPELKQELLDVYKTQQLIYSNLEHKFGGNKNTPKPH